MLPLLLRITSRPGRCSNSSLCQNIIKSINNNYSKSRWKIVDFSIPSENSSVNNGCNGSFNSNDKQTKHIAFITYNHKIYKNLGYLDMRANLSDIEFYFVQPKYGRRSAYKHVAFLLTEFLWFLAKYHKFDFLEPQIYDAPMGSYPSANIHYRFPRLQIVSKFNHRLAEYYEDIEKILGFKSRNLNELEWSIEYAPKSCCNNFNYYISYNIPDLYKFALISCDKCSDRYFIYLAPNPQHPFSDWHLVSTMIMLLAFNIRLSLFNDISSISISDLLIPYKHDCNSLKPEPDPHLIYTF